ncbi:MAG: C40 family peptidase [Bacteroidetes bacterium]|nr:C40 family peptidase [Bacteroidota bacterium]MBU2507666.1 C40 family peptidase [Bacteroidota bacterium]
MKYFITCLLFITLSTSHLAQSKMEEVKSLLEEMKMKYAPDKRVALFSYETEESGEKILVKGETNIPEAYDELKNYASENEVVELLSEILPSEKLGEKKYGIVNLSAANIRSKPEHPAELATQAIMGTPVKVLKYSGGFYLVQTPDLYISWIDDDGIALVTKNELMEWLQSEKIIFTSEYGFSYSKADDGSQRVSDLVIGNMLKYLGDEGEFYKVEYPDGKNAFVRKNNAAKYSDWLNSLVPNGSNVIKTAFSFMGIPYLWGGTSAKGMDCSGFTKTVYFLHGIMLQRDASQQVYTGELVDTTNNFANLEVGDLLFFGRKATEDKKEKVTHVAIYIGNMDYIHASGSVKVNSLDKSKDNFSEYRLKSFIRAKRILNSIDKNGISTLKSNLFYNGEF